MRPDTALAADEPFPGQQLVRLPDRDDGDTQVVGQLRDRRQHRAERVLAFAMRCLSSEANR
jgi:hypothetical protein